MTISLLFFGIPYFLGKLSETEMGESEETEIGDVAYKPCFSDSLQKKLAF